MSRTIWWKKNLGKWFEISVRVSLPIFFMKKMLIFLLFWFSKSGMLDGFRFGYLNSFLSIIWMVWVSKSGMLDGFLSIIWMVGEILCLILCLWSRLLSYCWLDQVKLFCFWFTDGYFLVWNWLYSLYGSHQNWIELKWKQCCFFVLGFDVYFFSWSKRISEGFCSHIAEDFWRFLRNQPCW